MGDPMRPLMWVSKSHAKLAAALREMGHKISAEQHSASCWRSLEYRRQVNRKTQEGAAIPTATRSSSTSTRKPLPRRPAGQPVISVDTKKKELIGNFKNGGSDYRPKGSPRRGRTCTTSRTRSSARSCPTACTTSTANAGCVSVGITSDTAEFAVDVDPALAAIAWDDERYPEARAVDDHGGLRRLQRCARAAVEGRTAEAGRRNRAASSRSATIRPARRSGTRSSTGCSATSRRTGAAGRSTSRLAVVELIGATTTKTGLKVESALDTRSYQKGIKVSNAEMNASTSRGDNSILNGTTQSHPET